MSGGHEYAFAIKFGCNFSVMQCIAYHDDIFVVNASAFEKLHGIFNLATGIMVVNTANVIEKGRDAQLIY
jgi:hypothetical protein